LATNQGVVGSIPASRTKNSYGKRAWRAISRPFFFVRACNALPKDGAHEAWRFKRAVVAPALSKFPPRVPAARQIFTPGTWSLAAQLL
ncbi:MAG: hypothetical protein V4857_25545, partial [Pseudomonadota bacterium]